MNTVIPTTEVVSVEVEDLLKNFRKRVDGEKLLILGLELSPLLQGDRISLKIKATGDGRWDYINYSICSKAVPAPIAERHDFVKSEEIRRLEVRLGEINKQLGLAQMSTKLGDEMDSGAFERRTLVQKLTQRSNSSPTIIITHQEPLSAHKDTPTPAKKAGFNPLIGLGAISILTGILQTVVATEVMELVQHPAEAQLKTSLAEIFSRIEATQEKLQNFLVGH